MAQKKCKCGAWMRMMKPRKQHGLHKGWWKKTIFGKPECVKCETTLGLTVHHFVPRSKGGEDVKSNRMVLCRGCHDDIHRGRSSERALTLRTQRLSGVASYSTVP